MIRHVFMDLDNTLLDFSKAEAIAVKKTLKTLGIECPEAVIRRYSQLNLAQWKLLELGTLTREQVKIRRYQLLFNELGTDASPQEAARIYEELLAVGHYFIDGAEWLLDSLYGRYKLYLATNGTAGSKAPGSEDILNMYLFQRSWTVISLPKIFLSAAFRTYRILKQKRRLWSGTV